MARRNPPKAAPKAVPAAPVRRWHRTDRHAEAHSRVGRHPDRRARGVGAFSFLDQNKSPQGYSVDICLKIADAIKAELKMPRLDVKFVPVSSASRIPALIEGKVDLECGSTTNTRDRQKQVAFAYTTFVAGIKMLAKKSSNINGMEDLRGKTIVVTKGTTSEKMINVKNVEQSLKLNILVAADHNESFRMVDEGKAVAFPMDDAALRPDLEIENPTTTRSSANTCRWSLTRS
jgi:ABC-type amino acid transport substrate-binding protein